MKRLLISDSTCVNSGYGKEVKFNAGTLASGVYTREDSFAPIFYGRVPPGALTALIEPEWLGDVKSIRVSPPYSIHRPYSRSVN